MRGVLYLTAGTIFFQVLAPEYKFVWRRTSQKDLIQIGVSHTRSGVPYSPEVGQELIEVTKGVINEWKRLRS